MRRFALRQPKGYVIALIDAFEDIGDAATHAFGCDAVCGIVGLLLFAPAVGLVDRRLETVRHAVGIEDCAAVDVASGPADRLDQ